MGVWALSLSLQYLESNTIRIINQSPTSRGLSRGLFFFLSQYLSIGVLRLSLFPLCLSVGLVHYDNYLIAAAEQDKKTSQVKGGGPPQTEANKGNEPGEKVDYIRLG